MTKFVSAQEAVSVIPSFSRVVVTHAAGEPYILTDALVDNAAQYENVEIVHMVAMGKSRYCEKGMEPHFRHNSLFAGATTRAAVNSPRGDFTPCFFHQTPKLFHKSMPIDAVLLQVSPPDENGNVSLGISVDYTMAACKCAKRRIAQINANMPVTCGDTKIPLSMIEYAVKADTPLIELHPGKLGGVEEKIGEHCARLIQDGDTLQLGIGAIPDAVLKALHQKKNLGIHSELFPEGVLELIDAGVINNKKKTLHPGKSVATFVMGTKRLYDYVHNNPDVEIYPVEHVNDPVVIAQNDNMVSINSCVQVDLLGQVVSCMVGPRQISGVGGQVDFVRGANMSRGGRSIMAMPARTKHGYSKIVAAIDRGAAVTTSRYDVGYVVTEYGIADLFGKTVRERARALIAIAHPEDRDRLSREWEQL